jgi:hypothetical protein
MSFARWFVAASIAGAAAAHAEPGGTTGVSSPAVTQGASKIEFRTTAWRGGALDGDWSHRASASYAFTDWWRPTLVLRASQPDGSGAELRSVGFENVFYYTPSRDWPVQIGAQGEYKFDVNGAEDEVEFKFLAERRDGPLNARLNLIGARAVGSGASDEWTHEIALRAMWRTSERFSLGFEAFSEPEAQAHYLGPRASLAIGDVSLSAGYLAGIDDARADGQLRLALEITP